MQCLFEEQSNKNYLELKYLIFDDFSLNLDVFYFLSILTDWLTNLNWETVMTSGPYC